MNCFWMESGKNSVKTGRLYKIALPLALIATLFLCTSFSDDTASRDSANINSLVNLNRGLQAFGFRTQEQWNQISHQQILPYYAEPFSPGLTSKIRYMIFPYWQGDLYKDYFFDNINRIGYLGYMIDPYTGKAALTYSWTVNNVTETAKLFDTAVDLVVYCNGKNETDNFLTSEKSRAVCIQQVLKYANKRDSFPSTDPEVPTLYNADGINVFFPDFSFEKKREFGLFIKDLFWFYRYGKESKKLIVTFPLRDTVYYNFLDGLNKYIDEVYFADYDFRGVNKDTVATSLYWKNYIDGNNEMNILEEMINEIRLAKFYNPLELTGVPVFESNWLNYLIAIVGIIFLILITIILSIFWGRFNQLITENITIVFLVGALLITEVIFLFLFMVEEMNFDTWLINTDNPGSKYFLMIPLILILVFPVIRLLQGRRHLP